MQPAFHRQRIAGYGDVMAAYAERGMADWRDGQTRDVHADMMAITQAIVAKTLFDADVSDAAWDVGQALHVLMEDFSRRRTALFALPRFVPTPGAPAHAPGRRAPGPDRLRHHRRPASQRRGPRRPALASCWPPATPTTAAA